MDEMSTKGSGANSDSGSNSPKNWQRCNCGGMCGHRAMRWVIGIVILLVVFALGVMVGHFHSGYGSRSMMMRGGTGTYRQGMPMMRAGGTGYGRMPTSSTTPTSTTTIQH